MKRLRLLLLIGCGLAAGCGTPSTPASPTLDAAGEKEYERQQQQANSAEGKKPRAVKPEN
jgi:hypothetical protein